MKGFRGFEGQPDDAATLQLACSVCNRIAPHSDLATYGARCYACFRAYCDEINPPGHYTAADAVAALRHLQTGPRADPLSGARWLRDIELHHGGVMPNGLPLTRPQRDFWRTALAREIHAQEATE